jgi:hypothetical protein
MTAGVAANVPKYTSIWPDYLFQIVLEEDGSATSAVIISYVYDEPINTVMLRHWEPGAPAAPPDGWIEDTTLRKVLPRGKDLGESFLDTGGAPGGNLHTHDAHATHTWSTADVCGNKIDIYVIADPLLIPYHDNQANDAHLEGDHTPPWIALQYIRRYN